MHTKVYLMCNDILCYLEAVSSNDSYICWYPVTELYLNDVTDDQLLGWNSEVLAITNDSCILHKHQHCISLQTSNL